LPSTATACRHGRGVGDGGSSGGDCRAGQPGTDGAVQRVGVDPGQHAAHGGLAGRPPGASQGISAHPERAQHLAGRVAGPLTDRGKRPGASEHGSHRDGQHRNQCVPSASAVARVADLGEVVEQVTALLGCQRGGRSEPMGSRNGR
jgi:hypothetical protein